MASLGEIDKHGRVQTGLKATKRIVEKAALRPGEGRGRTDRVCDVVRAMLHEVHELGQEGTEAGSGFCYLIDGQPEAAQEDIVCVLCLAGRLLEVWI